MCRYAYLAVVFRGAPPSNATELVKKHAAAAGRPITPLSPEPGSELARFAHGAHVTALFDCAFCACGWEEEEFRGVAQTASALLRGSDVLRVRLGSWFIDAGVDSGNRHRKDPPIETRELTLAGLAGVDWSEDVQLIVRRSGPPWPTRRLAQLRS